MVQDLATEWLQSCPCKTKTSQETQKSLRQSLEPAKKPKVIYTDNSLELANLVKNFFGVIVRQRHTHRKLMGLLREQCAELRKGHPSVLLQSGLDGKWWADAMECYCHLRNIQDLLSDGKHLTNGDSANH